MNNHGLRNTIPLFVFFCTVLLASNPAFAKECIDCHSDILKQFRSNSHHVQGTGLTGSHCYACHWEATADGRINAQYHKTTSAKRTVKTKSSVVDLVVWENGVRPDSYKQGSTAVTFSTSSIGSSSERKAIAKVTTHCLGCHNDAANEARPFAGDDGVPLKYAWDGQSVGSRYAAKGATIWGKYSTASTNKKSKIIKAYSAHGNSAANQGGWSAASGYDGATTITRGGANAKNVECFDCHNSHGSKVSGTTTSYRTFNGTSNGGILKETVAGKGGYRTTYKPSANPGLKSKNPYNAGAGLCFDCHETAKAGATPWGYNTTFGAGQPIIGYKDSLRFNSGVKGSTSRFINRQSRADVASSHLKAGSYLNYSTHGKINGLCTPCHDPHGISQTLGDNMPYAVPLLKGTWLTSPYREDGPPAAVQGKPGSGAPRSADYNSVNRDAGANFGKGDSGAPRKTDYNTTNRDGNANFGKGDSGAPRPGDYNSVNRDVGANFGKGDSSSPRKSDFNTTNREDNSNFGKMVSGAPREPMQGMKYSVDRNTFGGKNRITENDATFGGICLKCHAKENFAGNSKTALIHRAVKGWGANKEHSFPCSKCHQSHSSGLPRLMQTNCFQDGPSGLRENSGLAWLPYSNVNGSDSKQSSAALNDASKNKVVGCHVKQFGKSSASSSKKQDGQWKELTPW